MPTVIGKANEASLLINDKQVLKLSIQFLDKVFSIKGAGGHEIPYFGVVKAVIPSAKENMASAPVILLVVTDTEYHCWVPVLLGTNVLSLLRGKVPTEKFVC